MQKGKKEAGPHFPIKTIFPCVGIRIEDEVMS